MKKIHIEKIENNELLSQAKKLPNHGELLISPEGLVYLNIINNFIHNLFPLLNVNGIQKPDYFTEGGIGAHISVIYPTENIIYPKNMTNMIHTFTINGLYSAVLENKKYCVLGIDCHSLVNLRLNLGLTRQLIFKNNYVDFHITIGWMPDVIKV